MEYTKGQKFIIEIASVLSDETGQSEPLYQIKPFKSMVLDEYGLSKLTEFSESPYIYGGMGILWSKIVDLKKSGNLDRLIESSENLDQFLQNCDHVLPSSVQVGDKVRIQNAMGTITMIDGDSVHVVLNMKDDASQPESEQSDEE